MSENVLLTLISLASGPKDAHQLLDDVRHEIGSRAPWQLGPLGSTLRRLHTLSLVEAVNRAELQHGDRRVYRLTDAGRARLLQEIAALDKIMGAAHGRLGHTTCPHTCADQSGAPETTENRRPWP
jgi:DNA-binding PadR family transcriptional regulator